MDLDETAILYLRWLAQQHRPMWGGHLERGEPLADGVVKDLLTAGLIAIDEDRIGYMITEAGRNAIAGGKG